MSVDTQLLGKILHERGFKDWFLFYFKQIEGQKFILENIHNDLFKTFQNIYDLKTTRQIINIPPRSAKTTLAIYFIAYCLAKNLKCNFIYTSFSQELLNSNSKRLADILSNQLYIDMYLSTIQEQEIEDNVVDDFWKEYYKLNDNKFKFSSRQIITSKNGTILFNSIGASITGFGAGIRGCKRFSGMLIIDDANKPNEVHSEKIRNKVIRYYEETLLSRLNNSNTPILNIQQRLHIEDLSGYLIKEHNFKILKKALINEKDVCQLPKQYSKKRIEELKKNTYLFSSQYQQEPILSGGNLIKTEYFNRYKEIPESFESVYVVCDTAFSTKTSADNSAFMCVGLLNNKLYVIDIFCDKVGFVELKNNLKDFYEKYKTKYTNFSTIFIENKGSGQSLIQEFRSYGLPVGELYPSYYNSVQKKELTTDKLTRYYEVEADIINGYVYVPDGASWLYDFIQECQSFTGTGQEHDDRVDCLIYALKVRRKQSNIDWKKIKNAFM